MTAPESAVAALQAVYWDPDNEQPRSAAEQADALYAAGYVVLPREALPESPYTGLRNCLWCERHDYEVHADDCGWRAIRAAIEAT